MKLTSGQRTQTHELLAKHKVIVTTLDAAFSGRRITTEGLTAVTKGIGVSAYRTPASAHSLGTSAHASRTDSVAVDATD